MKDLVDALTVSNSGDLIQIRNRELPDGVPCMAICPASIGRDKLLVLLDKAKPDAWAHLCRLLAETALISVPVDLLLILAS